MATLPLIPLHQLTVQSPAACFAVLADKQSRSTRDGHPFFILTLKDRKRSVTATVWSDSPVFAVCRDHWAPGGYYRLQGVLLQHEKYGPQFEIRDGRDVRPNDRKDGFNEADLILRSRFDSDRMLDELIALATHEITSESVRLLVTNLLTSHGEAICLAPASLNRYHPFPGGWLEHTLSVCKTCLWLTDYYGKQSDESTPPLNRDLIVAAAVLHEIGRIAEWSIGNDPSLPPERTIPGQLHGALILARDLIRDAAKQIPDFDPQFLMLLEHVILSYLTLPEWGSPRLPAIPEVLILHHADDLDAKMEMYGRCLMHDQSAGPFTDPDPVLKRPLLKSRTV